MVYNSIFVILGITASLLVLSLVLFFKSRKKPKSFGVYFLLPVCLAAMALYGLGIGLSEEINYQNAVKERNQQIANFAADYAYYLEGYQSVLAYYNSLDSTQQYNLFKNDYNLEPKLDSTKLRYTCQAGDTFWSYFYRHYPRDYRSSYFRIYDYNLDLTFYVYAFSGTGRDGTPNFISTYSDGSYQSGVNNLNILNNYLEQGISVRFYGQDYLYGTPFSIAEYIIMLVYVGAILIFCAGRMIIVFIRGGDVTPATVGNTAVNGNVPNPQAEPATVTPPAPPKPTWEELSAAEQKTYLDLVIKLFYEKQLKDPTAYELTRQQIAMRSFAVQNKQFFLEDLTADETEIVQKIAKENYENGKPLPATAGQNVEIPPESPKSILKKGFKWFIYNSMITTRDRQLNTKTTTFKSNGYGGLALEQKDNSNKASLIRPCGKCMSVSGEKPLDFVVGFNPFKKVFYCCGAFKGFSFTGDDILQYRTLSSNAKSEKYELIHKTGKKIMVSFNPIGSELLNAILGTDKFVG